jgi:hypothetical protein
MAESVGQNGAPGGRGTTVTGGLASQKATPVGPEDEFVAFAPWLADARRRAGEP